MKPSQTNFAKTLRNLSLLAMSAIPLTTLCDTATAQQPFELAPTKPASSSGAISDEKASVQCFRDIQVAAQSDGLIQKLLVDEGSSVKKGDVLLIIDDRVAQAEVSVALKEWEAADKQAKETANIQFAKKASELSDKEYFMEADLYEKGATTRSALERKKLEAEKARFGKDVAEVEHQKEVLAAEVNREKHSASKVRLQLHQVTAQFDGVVVRRHRDEGEWVRAGEPVFQLMHLNEMEVQAYVPVKDLSVANSSVANLQGAPMKIVIQAGAQPVVVDSQVQYVSPEIDAGKVRVWTRIPNQAPGGIWLLRKGMPAVVEITPIR
jgi:RND family efflux transporter MFP subunit